VDETAAVFDRRTVLTALKRGYVNFNSSLKRATGRGTGLAVYKACQQIHS
jgi:hypothetical protein